MKFVWMILTFYFSWGAPLAGAVMSSPDHPQGELWRLLESGNHIQAQQLEQKLTDIFMNAPMDRMAPLGGGASESYIVKFPGNIYAVVKSGGSKTSEGYFNEVAAYKLDRLLNLNMVPLTVLREVNGRNYSLQLFYPEFVNFSSGLSPKLSDFLLRLPDLEVFDFLLANNDRDPRKSHNVVFGREGRLVAIDHEYTFAYGEKWPLEKGFENITGEFRSAIMNFNASEVKLALKDLLRPSEITFLLKRLTHLKNSLLAAGGRSQPFITPSERWHLTMDYPDPLSDEQKYFDVLKIKTALDTLHTQGFTNEVRGALASEKSARAVMLKGELTLESWNSYSPAVKEELLKLIWTKKLIVQLKKKYPDLSDDLEKISAERAKTLNRRNNVISCSNVF